MKLFFLISIIFSFVKSLQKVAVIDKSIDPSLYSQVDSYYNDLFKKVLNTRDQINEEKPGTFPNDEEIKAFKLIDELTQDFHTLKTTKKPSFNKEYHEENRTIISHFEPINSSMHINNSHVINKTENLTNKLPLLL